MKLKSIIAAAIVCAVGLSAFAEEPDEEVVATAEATFVLGPALAVANVKTATHWPWDGKIDVTCDLTGSGNVQLSAALTTNGVKVCDATAANLTGETEIDLDQVGGVTNGVKFVWNAKADCPAGFNSKDTKVKVSLIAVKAAKPVAPEGFVDLGVKDADGKPLFWAEKNLGASNPEDYGDYFAWGETAPYYTTTGGWPATPTWKSGKESGYAWQSYCDSSSFSEWSTPPYDATTKILKPEFDAATAVNSSWRTQTSEEFIALAANCVWIWCDGNKEKYNNTTVKGYIVYKAKNDADKGKANMNGTWKKWDLSQSKYVTDGASEATGYTTSDPHIFFPAAGYSQSTSLTSAGSVCRYWSSSRTPDSPNSAFYLYCNSSNVFPQFSNYRNCGASVRPVTN